MITLWATIQIAMMALRVAVVYPAHMVVGIGRGAVWAVSRTTGAAGAAFSPVTVGLLVLLGAVVWIFGPSGSEQRAAAAAEEEATRPLRPNELCLDDSGPEPRTEPCTPGVFRDTVTDRYCDDPFAFIGTDVDPRYADTYYYWCENR